MELGNMMFGNSRGLIEVPRKLVDCPMWNMLVNDILQVEDYHCVIGTRFEDENGNYTERTNGITPNKYGGYALIDKNNEVIFELFPYWWGDCTCGADEYNDEIYEKIKSKYFTKSEYKIYSFYPDWCADSCPCFYKDDLPDSEKIKICTCGTVKKNLKTLKMQKELENKANEFEQEVIKNQINHKDDCLLVKHNFIYHPGKEDEFWIDWYKYPFRDSYMNKDYTIDKIENIFKICIEEFKRINAS